jgi:NitT/TauT family transport system ATP-binding protein
MAIDPIPAVSISKMMGLLEFLDDVGGKEDVFRLAREINYEFGEILMVIKAAELLDLVVTPGGDVVVTATGSRVLRAKINPRKKLLKEQIKRLSLFQLVLRILKSDEDQRAEREVFLEAFALHLPAENPANLLETVIDWGRYTELLGYDPDEDQVYVDQEN